MDCVTNLDAELDRYFIWLAQFEAAVPHSRAVAARWFRGSTLQAHTTYSWFRASTPGVPALCLLDVSVANRLRGRGCFTRFVERFLEGSDNLVAPVLYMDNIASPRFERWLLHAGFQRCPYGSGGFSSFFLVR